MNKIDFTKTEPAFENEGGFKWYIDPYFQEYINTKQKENLPKLENLGCFVVVNEKQETKDFVLINNKQQIIDAYPYNNGGFEQMEAKLNMLKITKHFDDYENKC